MSRRRLFGSLCGLISGDLADRLPHVPYILGIVTLFSVSVVVVAASGLVTVVIASILVGFVVHMLFPAMDTSLLGSLPDDSRASAYAVFSAGQMATQASGSWIVGEAVEAGVAYDTVFLTSAAGLGLLVAVCAVLHRAGRIPG